MRRNREINAERLREMKLKNRKSKIISKQMTRIREMEVNIKEIEENLT
jgi:hypothetical protein